MSVIPAPAPPAPRDRIQEVEVFAGLLPTVGIGTNAGISLHAELRHHALGVTAIPAVKRRALSAAEEVSQLRDEICRRGLTRQDIARGIGIDRRSLSGYVRGEINPQPERLEALRILARISREIDAEQPGKARDVLHTQRGPATLLDVLAAGRYAVAAAWRLWIDSAQTQVHVQVRSLDRPPIWSAAARALAEGRLSPPPRASTVRPDATYHVDPADAELFAEPDAGPRRPGYR